MPRPRSSSLTHRASTNNQPQDSAPLNPAASSPASSRSSSAKRSVSNGTVRALNALIAAPSARRVSTEGSGSNVRCSPARQAGWVARHGSILIDQHRLAVLCHAGARRRMPRWSRMMCGHCMWPSVSHVRRNFCRSRIATGFCRAAIVRPPQACPSRAGHAADRDAPVEPRIRLADTPRGQTRDRADLRLLPRGVRCADRNRPDRAADPRDDLRHLAMDAPQPRRARAAAWRTRTCSPSRTTASCTSRRCSATARSSASASAGDLPAIRREIEGGAQAIRTATGTAPRWYRAATGFYTPSVIPEIEAMGFAIGGYSFSADLGRVAARGTGRRAHGERAQRRRDRCASQSAVATERARRGRRPARAATPGHNVRAA